MLALRALELGAIALLLACFSACVSRGPDQRLLGEVWLDYQKLPDQRALAIAGDLKRNRWVAGASAGHATREAAQQGAMRECALRRQRQRMQDACQLYAVGDEVVWKAPGTSIWR